MALADEIAVKLGLKTTEFKAALKDVNAEVRQFKAAGTHGEDEGFSGTIKGIHHQMRLLHQFLLAGGILTLVSQLFSKGAEYAKNYTGAIDENVEAMKRLEAATGDLKDLPGKAMVFLAGTMEKFGLAVGAAVYGVDAASDALTEMNEAAQKAFDAKRVEAFDAAMAKLNAQRRDQAYAEGSFNQKEAILAREQYDLAQKMSVLKKDSVEYVNLQAQMEKKTYDYQKLQSAEVEKQLKDFFGPLDGIQTKRVEKTKEEAAAEKKVTKEVETQAELEVRITAEKNKQISIAGIRGGSQFNDASDAALAEVSRRNRAEALAIQGGKGGFGIGQNLEVARLLAEALNAEKELAFRRDLKNTIQFQGVDAARAAFGGDPLLFDRVLAQFNEQQDKSTNLLQSLDDRMQAAGFGRR